MAKKKVAKKKTTPKKDTTNNPKTSTGGSGFAGARVERIIREAGAFRVSADAIQALNQVITERGTKISKYAVEIANHSGRKTVKADDIKLAATKVE
ncbi:MAG: histone family protein [Candidatus Hodarchaeales archaeon]